MKITSKELAARLGLSPAAVSMALNNKPGVSTATRHRVLEAAREFGYDTPHVSRDFVSKKEICFAIYKKHGAVVTDSPFFSEVSEGVAVGCKKEDYKLKLSYIYEDEETLSRQIDDIRSPDCSGLILLATEMNASDAAPFLKLPFPVVFLDAYFETVPCNCVLINNMQGAFLATRYLIQKCRKQPGYLQSAYPINNFRERAHGFYNAVREAGMSPSGCVVHSLAPSAEGAYTDMSDLLKQGTELAACYFADNDLIAAGAMKAFREYGLGIPDDISIVGFDDMPTSSMMDPGLTTIYVPKQFMGEAAVHRLHSLMEDPGQPPTKTEISTVLIRRQSVMS